MLTEMFIATSAEDLEQKMENSKNVINVMAEVSFYKMSKLDLECKCKCKRSALFVMERAQQWQQNALIVEEWD